MENLYHYSKSHLRSKVILHLRSFQALFSFLSCVLVFSKSKQLLSEFKNLFLEKFWKINLKKGDYLGKIMTVSVSYAGN